jgi:hypothetical protein
MSKDGLIESGFVGNLPVCPKCSAWTYYVSSVNGKPSHTCRDCGYRKKLYTTDWWKTIKARFKFW